MFKMGNRAKLMGRLLALPIITAVAVPGLMSLAGCSDDDDHRHHEIRDDHGYHDHDDYHPDYDHDRDR